MSDRGLVVNERVKGETKERQTAPPVSASQIAPRITLKVPKLTSKLLKPRKGT